jgi:hypothetical protein
MIQEHIVDSPEKCYTSFNLKLGKELGRGDFGIAYDLEAGAQNAAINSAISASGQYVLKQITIGSEKGRLDFINEVNIGIKLGDSGIAPKIYKSWFCQDSTNGQLYGYYVMDKLSSVWKGDYGHQLGNQKHQQQLITAIEGMVHQGYLHQDCHVGNIGFVAGNVKLFDFGLTLEIPREECATCFINPTITPLRISNAHGNVAIPLINRPIMGDLNVQWCKNLLTASQLFIVIEQYNSKDMFSAKNLIYHKIQQLVGPIPKQPTQQIITFEKQKQKIREALHHVTTTYGSCCDVIKNNILMTYLYQIIESYSISEDYSTELYEEKTENFFPGLVYDLIYDIRLGKIHLEIVEDWFNAKLGIFPKTKTVKPKAVKSTAAKTGAKILPKPVSTRVGTRASTRSKGKGGTRMRNNKTKKHRR